MKLYLLQDYEDIPKYSQVNCESGVADVRGIDLWKYRVTFKGKEYFINEELKILVTAKQIRENWREAHRNAAK